jgi:hypothetical protein
MQLLSPLQHDFYLHSSQFIQDKGANSVNTINRNVVWLVNGLDFGLFAIDLCDDKHTQQNRQTRQAMYVQRNIVAHSRTQLCYENATMRTLCIVVKTTHSCQ